MEDNLISSFLSICRSLEKYDVQYMIVGGAAVALHGYYRMSKVSSGEITDKPDIDIWYNPTYENYYNILKVLEDLGWDTKELEDEKNPDPRRSFLRFEFDDFTIDFLPQIKAAIRFRDATKRKETIVYSKTPIHYISYPDLVKDKRIKARKKDIEDIEELKKRKSE